MTPGVALPVWRTLSAGCGLLMAVSAAAGAHGPVDPAALAAAVGAVAVLAGLAVPSMATVAVVLAVAAIALGDPVPEFAAVSGLCAAIYLVLRHTAGGAVAVTAPTLIAAVGFSCIGVATTMVGLQVPWLPLLAPPLAFGCYLLATRPFLGDRG